MASPHIRDIELQFRRSPLGLTPALLLEILQKVNYHYPPSKFLDAILIYPLPVNITPIHLRRYKPFILFQRASTSEGPIWLYHNMFLQ